MNSPLLSVCLITYNHAKFIEQSIDGVLKQTVDFPWEFIIADDCSTDGTAAIVRDYADRMPDLIRPILQSPNLGGDRNVKQMLRAAKGKYIAYLEGDDYWSDPLKLQTQVDFLEENPDFTICFHNTLVVYEQADKDSHLSNNEKRDVFSFEDILAQRFFMTGSCVYRNGLFGDLPDSLLLFDWVLHLLNSRNGKIKYMDTVMGVYRRHERGWSYSDLRRRTLEAVGAAKASKTYFDLKYSKVFDGWIAGYYASLCMQYFRERKYGEFNKTYAEFRSYMPGLSPKTKLAINLRYYLSKYKTLADIFNYVRGLIRPPIGGF